MLINNLLRQTKSTPSVSTTTYFLVDLTNFGTLIDSTNNIANTLSKYVKSITLPERKVDTTSIDG